LEPAATCWTTTRAILASLGLPAPRAADHSGASAGYTCKPQITEMKAQERIHLSAGVNMLTLLLFVFLPVLHGCSGPSHLHKIRVKAESGEVDQQEFVRNISRPVIDQLSQSGFQCRTDYGHSQFYAACTRTDDSGIGQTTNTFINILYPDSAQEVEITITTGQLSYHPFARSSREFFAQWRGLVLTVIDSLPDVSYSDYEVE